MRKVLLSLAVFFLNLNLSLNLSINLSLAQIDEDAPTPQIQRSQDILEKEEDLRDKVFEEQGAFIREIRVEGVVRLPKERIRETIEPLKNRWLKKKEIERLCERIRDLYIEEGLGGLAVEVSYEVENKVLKIRVVEPKGKKSGK